MLPMHVEDLSAEWLTIALGEAGHDVTVNDVEVQDVVWGTATKVLLRLTYDDGGTVSAPPSTLCVKGGFDERLRGFAVAAGYHREVAFYSDLGPSLDLRLPRCWYAKSDATQDQAVVILDDLGAQNCTFGEPVHAWDPARVAAGLEVLASLHGQTWGWTLGRRPWLDVGATAVRQTGTQLLAEPHWSTHFAKNGAPELPEELDQAPRLLRAFQALWERDDASVHCVVHGDAHIGNTYVTPDGRPAFLDWQMACLAPWSSDVAYFISGALEIEDRRAHERDLLAHYLGALAASGGPDLDSDAAWQDYGVHQLHGVLWAVNDETMQPFERSRVMAERHAAAALDHDALAALGVR